MNDFRFSSDQSNEFERPSGRQGFDLSGMFIKWGIVKNRKQAEYVMIGIIIVVVAIIFLQWRGSGAPAPVEGDDVAAAEAGLEIAA